MHSNFVLRFTTAHKLSLGWVYEWTSPVITVKNADRWRTTKNWDDRITSPHSVARGPTFLNKKLALTTFLVTDEYFYFGFLLFELSQVGKYYSIGKKKNRFKILTLFDHKSFAGLLLSGSMGYLELHQDP